jgi:hypothetical protein
MHTITAKDFSFSGALRLQGSFNHTFEQPGVYEYICGIHPAMKSRVGDGIAGNLIDPGMEFILISELRQFGMNFEENILKDVLNFLFIAHPSGDEPPQLVGKFSPVVGHDITGARLLYQRVFLPGVKLKIGLVRST